MFARLARSSLALLALWSVAGCDDKVDYEDYLLPPESTDFDEIGRCDDFNPLKTAYFGDTHVHTRYSLDANLQGTRQTVRDAYRFAQGEPMGIQPYDEEGVATRTIQLERPLDFAMVSDHAEFFGLQGGCETPGSEVYDSRQCQQYRNNAETAFIGLNLLLAFPQNFVSFPEACGPDGAKCRGPAQDIWADTIDAAEAFYDRTSDCSFTTFVGYEWTGNPDILNLHRNVVFRNANVPDQPFSYFEEPAPEGLWRALRRECLDRDPPDDDTPPCDVLTIPHNSNLSGGRMFEEQKTDGAPLDVAYVTERASMEPLMEVFQHKGASECLPGALTGDEECDFEILPYSNLAQPVLGSGFGTPNPADFLRHVLARGLALEEMFGVNPFKYGVVASTDTHIAAAGNVTELDFPGNGGAGSGNIDGVPPIPDVIEFNPGGLAVIWAEENSRPALFDAMRRKETYGTSGPRITLRFFGGWADQDGACALDAAAFAQQGYDSGVPMGGTLRSPDAAAPTFTVSALRDPGTAQVPGTALEKIHIVKGWVDDQGTPQAKTYDVVAADELATVDEQTCEVTAGGADSLCAVWTDPDFDPEQRAYYYARVLESPTCRWSTRRCNELAPDCSDPDALEEPTRTCCRDTWNRTIKERAWSSPIWFEPGDEPAN